MKKEQKIKYDEVKNVVTIKGEEYKLKQRPYLDNDKVYIAYTQENEKGEYYEVIWDILEDYIPENNDESLACDWENPSGIKVLV